MLLLVASPDGMQLKSNASIRPTLPSKSNAGLSIKSIRREQEDYGCDVWILICTDINITINTEAAAKPRLAAALPPVWQKRGLETRVAVATVSPRNALREAAHAQHLHPPPPFRAMRRQCAAEVEARRSIWPSGFRSSPHGF